jgi:hypothetical protein
MAELNFGLLNPPGSQSIGNAFVSGMDQGQAARARDLQMQQSMRQGQMAELQLKKAQDAEAKLNQFYAGIAANGGPKDPMAIEDQMIGSGIPQVANTGLSARMARLGVERDRKLYAAANAPAAAPGVVAPMAPPPEPGSFGADVMERRAADPFAPALRANMLPGAAAPVATVNNLSAPPQAKAAIADLNRRIAANMALGTEQGYKTAEGLQKQATELNRLYTVGTTLMGSEGQIVGTAPEATSQEIRTMRELGYPNTPAGYAAFRNAQRPDQLLTPEEQKQKIDIALASRPPAQPPAPSTQTIADPTDPTKAIVIDARRYTPGGGINSPGVFGYAPPAKTAENIREEELKTAYNTNRILNSAVQIGKILKKTPSASQPGGLEASAMTVFGNAGVANLSRSEDRQIVAAAQSDIIDSLLYLATGAAYNKEQLAQQRQSYLPAFTDAPGTVVAKQDALRGLIDGAKVRSGRAWTPKMQSAVDLLTGGATTPAAPPPAPSPSKPTTAILVTTPDGKTYSFVTPEQAAAFKTAAGIP